MSKLVTPVMENRMRLITGDLFNFVEPDPRQLDLISIARVLSRIPRWGGHTREFYSVAQHSVMVAEYTEDPYLKLGALFHDAHEALNGFGDVCASAKMKVKEVTNPIEKKLDEAIAARFGFPVETMWDRMVKAADFFLTQYECDNFFTGFPPPELVHVAAPLHIKQFKPMPMQAAEAFFIAAYHKCTRDYHEEVSRRSELADS